MSLTSTIILLAAICSAGLGSFVLAKEPKKQLNFVFGGFCFILAAWITANFFLATYPSVFWLRGTYGFGAFGMAISVFWVIAICGKKITKRTAAIVLGMGLFFLAFSYLFPLKENPAGSSDLAVSGVEIEQGGLFFPLYASYITAVILFVVLFLAYHYRRAATIKKMQIGYVLVGTFLHTFSVLIVSLILPFFGEYRFSLFDAPSSLFFVFFSGLAITRYHLFEIKVILTEILVVAMGLVLLVLPFLMTNPGLLFLTAAVFVAFCFCGWLLIRNAIKETRQKETLEKTIQERTAALRGAKDTAEQRTMEVIARKEELEKFFRETVGRELQMVEMKNRIRDLESLKQKRP